MAQGERNDGDKVPMMVALMDSIGIAAELSHWSNSALDSLQHVFKERERENTCCQGIAMLEEYIKNGALAKQLTNYQDYVQKKNQRYYNTVLVTEISLNTQSSSNILDKSTLGNGGSFNSFNNDEDFVVAKRIKALKQKADNIAKTDNYQYRNHPTLNNSRYFLPCVDVHHKATDIVEFVYYHYRINRFENEAYLRVLEQAFATDYDSSSYEIKSIFKQLYSLQQDLTAQAEEYEAKWHKKNKSHQAGEEKWAKYQKKLNMPYYEHYKGTYAEFLQECDSYLTDLIDDVIQWVDCLSLKTDHPLSIAADDMASDSKHYAAFANDILMTLSMQIDKSNVSHFLDRLVNDSQLKGHNILWSVVLAGRKLTPDARRNCVQLLLSLDKAAPLLPESYSSLLTKLESVMQFDADEQKDAYNEAADVNAIVVNLSHQIENLHNTVFNQEDENSPLDTANALLQFVDSQRANTSNPGETLIPTERQVQAIKTASSASTMVLFNYLQKVKGKLSSEFAQAWLVSTLPDGVVRESILKLTQSYHTFTDNLKAAMLRYRDNMSQKLSKGFQSLTTTTQQVVKSNAANGLLVSALLGYQLYSLFLVSSDNSLKTKAQHQHDNALMAIAATGAISLSFRLATDYTARYSLNDSMLNKMKYVGNLFGFISGLTQLGLMWVEKDTNEKTNIEQKLFYVSFASQIVNTADLFFRLKNTTLVAFLEEKGRLLISLIKRGFIKKVAWKILSHLILGALFLLNPWVALALFLIELLIALTKEDEIEEWLRRCYFGKLSPFDISTYRVHGEKDMIKHTERYKTLAEEAAALKAIFKKYEKQVNEYYQEQAEKQSAEELKVLEKIILSQPPRTLQFFRGL